jgi:hypothetical protein
MPLDDQDLAPSVPPLDDDFVRGARFKEDSAEQRQRGQERHRKRAEKRRAKAIRRQWRPPRRFRAKDWVIPAITVVAAVYLVKHPPFGHPARPALHAAGATSAGTPAPGATTSTTYGLERLTYGPGDCVIWDQRKGGPDTRDTRVVPCDQPHLIEITGRSAAPDEPSYPTDSEWDRLIGSGDCGRQAAEYVGGELDPYGRFHVGAIRPSLQGWDQGDREMWCGLESVSQAANHDPDVSDPFTGTVHSQPQALLWPTRSCVAGQAATGALDGTVPCTDPHLYEIAGTLDASRLATVPPPDSPLWDTRLGTNCYNVARAAFGGRLPAGVQSAVFPIDPASWRAGRRTTECAVARFDATTHNPTTLTAPLLPAH